MPSLVARVSMNQTYVPNPYSSGLTAIRSAGGRTRGPAMPAVVARVSTNTCTSATMPKMASCAKLDSAVSWCRSAALCNHTAKPGSAEAAQLAAVVSRVLFGRSAGVSCGHCPAAVQSMHSSTACARRCREQLWHFADAFLSYAAHCYTARKLTADNVRALRRPLLLLTHCLN